MNSECFLVVFDLAGTTVQEDGIVSDALKAALTGQQVHVTDAQIARVRGFSKREAIFQLLPDDASRSERARETYAAFRHELMSAIRAHGVEAIKGAERTFVELKRRGVRVALNTGFDREITSAVLHAVGWDTDLVDAVVCGDDVPRGRPAPYLIFRAMEKTGALTPRTVVNVGDTTADLEAGNNALVRWNVGVLTGAHPRSELASAPHTHIIDSVDDLIDGVLA